MADYSRPADGIRFVFKGMNTVLTPDGLPLGKYPVASNVRAYLQDRIVPRLPQSDPLVTVVSPLVHSLRRLNDSTPPGPAAGYVLIIGAGTAIYVNALQVVTGLSGRRISMVNYRPNATPQPWMYIADWGGVDLNGHSVGRQVKVNAGGTAYNIGIREPQLPAVPTNGTLANPGINSPVFYRYRYRSSATGAKSNPSPPMRTGFSPGLFAPHVAFTPSSDPQADLVDMFRFDSGLLDYTYAGTAPNSAAAFDDTTSDADIATNPLLEFDNFEPFPTIDSPRSGTVLVSGTTVTWVSGDMFNPNLAPGTIIVIDSHPATTYSRPSTPTTLEILDSAALSSSEALRATVGANDGTGLIPAGTIDWTNPGNIASNSAYASAPFTAAGGVGITKALRSSGYGFTIPGGATIVGIQVNYEAYSTLPSAADARLEVYMYKPSAAAIFGPHMVIPIPSISSPEIAGNGSDLWSTNWTPADINNANFGPVFVGVESFSDGDIFVRNAVVTVYYQVAGSPVTYQISQPTLLGQPLPAWWGPTDNAGFFFACGDPINPGKLYFTKGNDPDSAPDTNQIEITSPSEPLIAGCIVGGLGMVFSSERAWLIYPNFSQAVATIVGIQGNPFNPVESISERGLYARRGICTDGGGWVYFITKDGIRKSPAGSGSSSITDEDLYNLFPHEGIPQQAYVVQSSLGVIFSISPPDYTNSDGMSLSFSQGYVYFDYIGLDGNRHTLVYDTINSAWSVDVYGTIVAVHADNEGEYTGVLTPGTVQSGLGSLMGCTDGTIRAFTPVGTENGTMTILTPSYNNGDRRSTKRFSEIYLESACPAALSPFTAILYADRYTKDLTGSIFPVAYPVLSNGLRQADVGSIALGKGVYVIDVGLKLTIPVTSVGAALFTWQPALVPQPETTTNRVTDWDDGGTSAAKLVQGVIVTADSFNAAKQFTIQSGDDLSVHVLAEMGGGVVFNGQSAIALSLATPFIAHNFRLLPDSAPWNLFKAEFVFVPYPELVKEWHTEGTSHGLDGWQHVKEINVAHLSTADLTLTLVRDFGPPISVTVPNSGGVQTKTLVQIPPPSKFKIVSYNISSSQPFRLWAADLEVWVADWEGDKFNAVKPFGGPARTMFSMTPGAII